jgi:hypothetical protein
MERSCPLRQIESLTLWIDAICINQDSEEERSQQVQLIGDIYKTAQQVLIWLGKGTRGSNLAFEYLSQFATQAAIPSRREAFEEFLTLELDRIGCKIKFQFFEPSSEAF